MSSYPNVQQKQGLSWQVDHQGNVVNVKTTDGVEYQVRQAEKSFKSPQWRKSYDRQKGGRWHDLKVMVSKQEPNVWYTYDGFANDKEVIRCAGVLSRGRVDKDFAKQLKGKFVVTTVDRASFKDGIFRLAACVVFIDKNGRPMVPAE